MIDIQSKFIMIRNIVIATGNIIQYFHEYGTMVVVLLIYLCSDNYPEALKDVTGDLRIIYIHVVTGAFGGLETNNNIYADCCQQFFNYS